MARVIATLAGVVQRSAPVAAREWFCQALAAGERRMEKRAFFAAYAGAGRHLRGTAVTVLASERILLAEEGLAAAASWRSERIARAVLLWAVVAGEPDQEHAGLVAELFRTGDNPEREALLGALVLLPQPQRFLATAIEACRSNVRTIFEAIACENPYPERYFPDASLNQMVLKAIFVGAAIARIEGIDRRMNAELVRMAEDYASERRAAGRPVPADIVRIASARVARREMQ